MADQPRLYRPAWFLRMVVRLDDFGQAEDGTGQDGAKPYQPPKIRNATEQAKLEAQFAEMAAGMAVGGNKSLSDLTAVRAQSSTLGRHIKATSSGNVKSSAGDDGKGDPYSVEFVTVPMEMSIEDKGFRTAGELTATFPFQDLPLDPSIIRECRVDAFVGTVTAEDFATPDKWHLNPGISDTCVLRFRGYIDPTEMNHDENAGDVHIKARSYEAVLIDGKINPKASAYRMAAGKQKERLSVYVNRILSLYPPTSGENGDPLRAYWYAGDPEKEPFLSRSDLLRSLQTAKSRNQASGNTAPGTPPAALPQTDGESPDPGGQGDTAVGGTPGLPPKAIQEDGMSIWDLITQVCELCGCIPMYSPSLPVRDGSSDGKVTKVDPANAILLTPPQAFLDDISRATQIDGGARDGFKRDFRDASGKSFSSDVRFMVWGHNISKMKLARKLGKVRPSAVEVRAYNPDAEAGLRVLSARYPAHGLKSASGKKAKSGRTSTKGTEKGHGKIDVVRTFVLKGIRSQAALEQAAISVYHQLTRSELTMEIETDDLSSFIDPDASQAAGALVPSHNGNPDLLKLCPGSPVHVTVAKKPSDKSDAIVISSLSDFYDVKGDGIVNLLTKQNDRWGAWRKDGSLDQAAIEKTAAKIQAAYRAAKLPDVYYCKAVKLNFSAESGFNAHMELASYMPDNDPKRFSAEDTAKNDDRKAKKHGAAKTKQAQSAATGRMIDKAQGHR